MGFLVEGDVMKLNSVLKETHPAQWVGLDDFCKKTHPAQWVGLDDFCKKPMDCVPWVFL